MFEFSLTDLKRAIDAHPQETIEILSEMDLSSVSLEPLIVKNIHAVREIISERVDYMKIKQEVEQ
jgi:hypothetical protein